MRRYGTAGRSGLKDFMTVTGDHTSLPSCQRPVQANRCYQTIAYPDKTGNCI